jgi:hypothetical protein
VLLERFAKLVEEHGVIERTPVLEGKSMFIVLASTHKPKVAEAPQRPGRPEDGPVPAEAPAAQAAPAPVAAPAASAAPAPAPAPATTQTNGAEAPQTNGAETPQTVTSGD